MKKVKPIVQDVQEEMVVVGGNAKLMIRKVHQMQNELLMIEEILVRIIRFLDKKEAELRKAIDEEIEE